MDHQEYRRKVNMEIDGLLPEQERAELYAHLACCSACADYMAALNGIEALLREELRPLPQTPDITAAVMSRLTPYAPQRQAEALPCEHAAGELIELNVARDQRRPRRLQRIGRVAAGLAAAILLTAGLSGLLRGSDQLLLPDRRLAANSDLPLIRQQIDELLHRRESGSDPSAEQGGNHTQRPENDQIQTADNTGRPGDPQSSESTENSDEHTVINGINLPPVAIDNSVTGSYQCTELAGFENCDAVLPHINGSSVSFIAVAADGLQQWQVSVEGGEPQYIAQAEYPPTADGIAARISVSETDAETGEQIKLSYFEDISINGIAARSSESGVRIIRGNGREQELASTGGELLSWSPDGNKLFFTDGAGMLWLYYPAEDMLLELRPGVSSACWCGGYLVFAAIGSSGYSCIFRITTP